MKELEALKLENDRLRMLAQQDSLTGLLNRGTIEKKINEVLSKESFGVLLMMDVDEFKYINDKFGHLTGDRILQELARVMGLYFFKKDLIGRMGGDEFVVFLSGRYTTEMVESKVEGLNSRIAQVGRESGLGSRLQITAGAEFVREGDSFQSLYERADAAMRAGKGDWKKSLRFYEPDMAESEPSLEEEKVHTVSAADIRYITRQLRENRLVEGAYCQDYNTFLGIYRFMERGLTRTGLKANLILISLTNQFGSFIPLEERGKMIGNLKESISSSLRLSDIYTQYSSCQFLAMALGASLENMQLIADRIQEAFRHNVPEREDIVLTFNFYPLQPVERVQKKWGKV